MENYGIILKRLRKECGLSVNDVISALKDMGISITPSALYNYENNTRATSADILLALCQIYNCSNILETFNNVDPDYSKPTDEEWELIEKYRTLDDRGKINILRAINHEYYYAKYEARYEELVNIGRVDTLEDAEIVLLCTGGLDMPDSDHDKIRKANSTISLKHHFINRYKKEG